MSHLFYALTKLENWDYYSGKWEMSNAHFISQEEELHGLVSQKDTQLRQLPEIFHFSANGQNSHFRAVHLQQSLGKAVDSPGDKRVAYTFTCTPGLSVNWMRSWFRALSRTWESYDGSERANELLLAAAVQQYSTVINISTSVISSTCLNYESEFLLPSKEEQMLIWHGKPNRNSIPAAQNT